MLLKIEDEIAYNVQWMLKSLKKEEIDFGSILEYKVSIKDMISALNVPNHIVVTGHDPINKFFTNLKFLKFSSTIIKIKQLSKADFKDVSMLFYALVQKFEIPLLMETIQNISVKNETQEHLRIQIKQLLEFKLVDLTKELLQFQREGEKADEVIESFFKEKEFDIYKHQEMIEFIKTSEHLSMSDLSVSVNHLLLI